jgi:enoyl-CoA hydratase/carnithine racemase
MSKTETATTDNNSILLDTDAGIVTITLNRPARYNALTSEVLTSLLRALDRVAEDASIHVVIIGARGKAFCSGHDLKEMRSREDQTFHRALFDQCDRMMQTIRQLPQPVIARVNGIATAAGCQLVAACDLAVAAEDARFAVSGINVGLFCSTPAVPLSRNIPHKQALQMLLTGDFIDAATALQYGLINEIVPGEKLKAATRKLAEKIAAKSPLAIRTGKKMFYRQLSMDLSAAYDFAAETMTCNLDSEDARKSIDAFIEKRKPEYKD